MRLLLVGDVMLGRLVNQVLKRVPPAYPWGDTLPIFQSADWRIGNLECVISDRGQPWSASPEPGRRASPKVFHFRSDKKNIAVLKAANINMVSLANNHTLDFEYEAMGEMLQILNSAKIYYAGAGQNLAKASQTATAKVNGLKIGLIAFTDNEPQWEAGEKQPGIFYVPIELADERAKRLLMMIKETKTKVDFLIVSAHWGPNWGYELPPEHSPFAHALIEAGADVVFGHSAHLFRGIELYQGKVILYSTGDFIDDYAVDEIERNDESFIFILESESGKIQRLCLYPTVIREFQARLAKGSEAEAIALKMKTLCAAFNTAAEWQKATNRLEIVVK